MSLAHCPACGSDKMNDPQAQALGACSGSCAGRKRALTPKQERKARTLRALLADESVPVGVSLAATALRKASHRYVGATAAGKYDAMAALYAAAVALDEELEKS